MSSNESFIEAVKSGNLEKVKSLLPRVADINAAYENGMTALHYAAEKGHTEIVELLLEYGVNVSVQDSYGRTPLHYAALGEDAKIIELLLKHGASVIQDDNLKITPLHFATFYSQDTEMVELLLKHGAKVNARCINEMTALNYAILHKHKEIVKMLFTFLVYGVELNGREEIKNTLELERCLEAFKEINNTPELKHCLKAFEEIKAMPRLGELIAANIKKDKEESTNVIDGYINDKVKQQELIKEFQTVKEKYGSDKQLAFIPKSLLSSIEYLMNQFLPEHKEALFKSESFRGLLTYLTGQDINYKNENLNISGADARSLTLAYEEINRIAKQHEALYNADKEKINALSSELGNICESPNPSLTEAQLEAASSQSQNVA